ncbi:MAG: SDR family oxidoreductase [Clostridiaceae bacterium]
MLIEKSNLSKNCLHDKVILVTGGGGGIGLETVKALAYLNAKVIIAEINKEKGIYAEESINKELNSNLVHFIHTDISDAKQIDRLYTYIKTNFKHLDVILNNAVITPLGEVEKVSIDDWDKSYSVNLRGPILLIKKFLPDMKKRNSGTIVFVPSSGAAPYMGAYEIFKTSQVELCNTLAGELENTSIITYSIGPGLVKTDTAKKAIETVSKLMNITMDEFYKMNENHIIDEETAGTGFAVSIALAARYNGLEIGSIQALIDGGLFKEEEKKEVSMELTPNMQKELKLILMNIIKTYEEQYKGWMERNIFERQWVLRDFKKTMGRSADEVLNSLEYLEKSAEINDINQVLNNKNIFIDLKKYYERQYKLLLSYEKNSEKLKESWEYINSWIFDIDSILNILSDNIN